jgi:hypothetical protein
MDRLCALGLAATSCGAAGLRGRHELYPAAGGICNPLPGSAASGPGARWFLPNSPALVETLPRRSGRPPDINARGISVRFEAIDALETHFGETHQELAGANAARDELLRHLGFTNVTFFPDLPNKVQSADQNALRGHVLSNGIDGNVRLIGFIYSGDHPAPDGSSVFVDEALVDLSVNALLLAAGHTCPAFYATLPATLRTHLAGMTARANQSPPVLWPRSTADPDGAVVVADLAADLAALEQLVIWPKLFRRIVPYFAAGLTASTPGYAPTRSTATTSCSC